jgi:hypothetical protein
MAAQKAAKRRKAEKKRCVTFNIMVTDPKDENWSEEMGIDVWFKGKIHARLLCGIACDAIRKALDTDEKKELVTGKVLDTTTFS